MSKLLAVAQFETTLASGISKAATTAQLVSNITGDQDDTVLPSGDYGFVIDESNGQKEYCIGTVSGVDITFVKRGLSFIDGDTEKTGNKFAHRKGSSIKIVSFPIITRMLAQLNGDLALNGIPKLPSSRTINNSRHIADKEYVDNILASGISSLAVTDNGGITININSGYYSLNGVITYYAGVSNQALTNNATNYVELVDGSLSINTTAFSNDGMPLAKVVTLSGDITSLTDARAILGWLDIKASSGIGRDANGIFIDLATNPALEFDSGKLRVKIKSSGGLVRDADGLSVDTGTSANKIVQLDSNGKLPALDASQLTGIVTGGIGYINSKYYYQLPFILGDATTNKGGWGRIDGTAANLFFDHLFASNEGVAFSTKLMGAGTNGEARWTSTKKLRVQIPFIVFSNPNSSNTYIFGLSNDLTGQGFAAAYKCAYFSIDNTGALKANLANGTNLESSTIAGVTLTNLNIFEIEIDGTQAKFYVNGVLKATLNTRYPSVDDFVGLSGYLDASTSKSCAIYLPTIIRDL